MGAVFSLPYHSIIQVGKLRLCKVRQLARHYRENQGRGVFPNGGPNSTHCSFHSNKLCPRQKQDERRNLTERLPFREDEPNNSARTVWLESPAVLDWDETRGSYLWAGRFLEARNVI